MWNSDFLRVEIMDFHPGHWFTSDLHLQSEEREMSTSTDVPGCDFEWLLGTCMSVSCDFPLQLIPREEGKEGFEEGRGKLFLGLHFHHSRNGGFPEQKQKLSHFLLPNSSSTWMFVWPNSTAIFKQSFLHFLWYFECLKLTSSCSCARALSYWKRIQWFFFLHVD